MTAPVPRSIGVHGYQVLVGPWLLEDAGPRIVEASPSHAYAIITDTNVGPVAGPALLGSLRRAAPRARILFREVEPGEERKTRAEWAALTDWLLGERCGRDTTVVALGGGVIADLAGFVAATFMRGVAVVQVPTTLLAMVDASVGGKVAVDTTHGKNLVGAFHRPAVVLVDPTVLQTLPSAERRAGYAEVLKHGLIADAAYLGRACDLAASLVGDADGVAWGGDALADLVSRSIEIKAGIVRADEREAGLRQVLNYGHTIGHALELASGFALRHGEAVAIGMVLEATLAERVGVAGAGLRQAAIDAVRSAGLPTVVPPGLPADRLLELMSGDKKARGGELYFALPEAPGRMAGAELGYGIPVDRDDVAAVLSAGA